MKLILKNGLSVLYKNGMGLTGLNINSIVAESKQDRADLRMLLMGALKVDDGGCHQIGRNVISGALVRGSNVSNGSLALDSESPDSDSLKCDYELEDKLQIIDTLSAVIQRNEPIPYQHVKEAERKLLALIQSI